MSVFTRVSPDDIEDWLAGYAIGTPTGLEGIAAGIENTNYFLTTTGGQFVLTLFEKLTCADLPFYIGLMAHLADRGVPCPRPVRRKDGTLFGTLNGKPAAIVTRLPGVDVSDPDAAQCAAVGRLLADMHLAGRDFAPVLDNPRGIRWWRAVQPELLPFLPADQGALLSEEIRFQSLYRFEDLPRGAIHADLFRDNVLFDGARLGGVIDFYFGCTGPWLYDLAVAVNDWCIEADGRLDIARADALLDAYRGRRPVDAIERGAWPAMLRAGALRFWLSRLYDFHLPRPGELTHAKDPEHFRRVLALRIRDHGDLQRMLG
jgi:homoserine kinase type II